VPEWRSCCGQAGLLSLSRPIEGVFQVLPVIYTKHLPSMLELPACVDLFAVWLDLGGRGSSCAKESPGCHLGDRGSCAKRQPWVHALQRQRDPTKGKSLWLVLVLDGVDRAWAKCKDKLLVRDLFPVAALFWSGVGKRRGCCASLHTEEGYPSKPLH